jgi:hypothetical protein
MATPIVAPTNQKVAKKRVFDLDTFEKKTVEVKYDSPIPFTKVDDVIGLPEDKLLKYVNKGVEREAWQIARASIVGVSPKAINITVNAFRQYMFQDLVETNAEGDQTPESRKKQTQAIYAFIRSNEQILNSMKDAAKRAAEASEENDDDGDDDDK